MRVIAIFVTVLAVSLAAPTESGCYSGEVDASKKVEKSSPEGPVLQDESVQVEKEAEQMNKNPIGTEVKTQEAPDSAASDNEESNDDEVSTDKEPPYKKPTIDDYKDICRATTGVTFEQVAVLGEKLDDDAPQEMKCYVQCMEEYLGNVRDKVLERYDTMFYKTLQLVDENKDKGYEICDSIVTDDPCHSSYLKFACYLRAGK
ncbi:uncharacterized protein LOC124185245 [Neodiprion fabricii]|uniref:uncharacterized protein LOC124185245 n=1 Tax=Neodiprion fabricii TaxID=2872261 RepID=UPI001ED9497A|nr:uncharacterized protein LOC124185245 [Neodiprion fabricii]